MDAIGPRYPFPQNPKVFGLVWTEKPTYPKSTDFTARDGGGAISQHSCLLLRVSLVWNRFRPKLPLPLPPPLPGTALTLKSSRRGGVSKPARASHRGRGWRWARRGTTARGVAAPARARAPTGGRPLAWPGGGGGSAAAAAWVASRCGRWKKTGGAHEPGATNMLAARRWKLWRDPHAAHLSESATTPCTRRSRRTPARPWPRRGCACSPAGALALGSGDPSGPTAAPRRAPGKSGGGDIIRMNGLDWIQSVWTGLDWTFQKCIWFGLDRCFPQGGLLLDCF